MAVIKPFAAVRPAAAFASSVAALPYDVYNREEAREAVKGKPLSFLNIDRAETQFSPDVDIYADFVYEKAASLIKERIADGTFIRDEKPCFYIYALTMDGRTQTGLVCCSSIDDYQHGVIRRHENTRADKEKDRIRHVDVCNAQTGPIFLTYRQDVVIKYLIEVQKKKEPVYDFVSDDGIAHKVWIIEDTSAISAIEAAFLSTPATYIADGHHRAASAVKVGLKRREENPGYTGKEEFNYFLSVLFPDNELKILPYNRVVKDLNGLSKTGFLEKVSACFTVTDKGSVPYLPKEKATFGMYLEGSWYELRAKKEICPDDPVDGLDVSILQNSLLSPILGIEDPKVDKRIDFVGGIRGLGELERRVSEDMKVAFSMYPTSIGELLSVADAGLLMPPKSTWFEPKLRSGLFLHMI